MKRMQYSSWKCDKIKSTVEIVSILFKHFSFPLLQLLLCCQNEKKIVFGEEVKLKKRWKNDGAKTVTTYFDIKF